jgi:hypothetical protein
MKCIKNNKTGDIQRVTDKEAYNMVGNTWSYVSKSEWKMVTRKPKKEEVVVESTEVVEPIKSKKQLRKEKVKA